MKDTPKLIAFDLDGTLAESKQHLHPEMGELITELLSKMPVAIMSGASFAQFEKQFLPALGVTPHIDRLYIFPTNAAQCFTHKGGAWRAIYDHSFSIFEKARILQALKESLEETGLGNPPERNPDWGEQIEDRGAQITFSALGQKAPIEVKREWDPSRERRKPLYDALVRRLPDFSIGLNANTSVDITQKGVNKAYGIRQLLELAEISISEILYIGDALEEGGNDAVVKETGVHTIEVFGPEETASIIRNIIKNI
jgi:hypothetical protein